MTVTAVEAVRNVDAADVYKAGRHAATLRRTAAGVEFAYVRDDAPPVATTLPRSRSPLVTPAGAVPPFFAGLLPEGRRLSSLRRIVKTSADDELSLLLAVGRDTIGDVQVVAEGEIPTPAEPFLEVQHSFSEVHFADLLTDAGIFDPVALPGVQDKVSARVISLPVAASGLRYILKVDPPEFPHVVANEAYFLGVARDAGIEVAEAQVVHDADGRPGLLVRRFDRVPGPGDEVAALACEDACQLLGRWPADKYNVTTEEVVAAVAAVCPAAPIAVRDVFRQLCFAWLTGNGDVHAKNISVLRTDGEWKVSPAYDLPSTLPYGDHTLALSMGGKRSGISRRRLLEVGGAIGLPERSALRVIDDVLSATARVGDDLARGLLPFTEPVVRDMRRELRNRRRLLS